MKVDCSPDVCRKLPIKRSAAATAVDLIASATFAAARVSLIAAACVFGTDLAQVMKHSPDSLMTQGFSAGKALA